tara:strand:- start:4029 stop:7286 length:3258 start_codon:yes stop_codon:yes gene_type:complete
MNFNQTARNFGYAGNALRSGKITAKYKKYVVNRAKTGNTIPPMPPTKVFNPSTLRIVNKSSAFTPSGNLRKNFKGFKKIGSNKLEFASTGFLHNGKVDGMISFFDTIKNTGDRYKTLNLYGDKNKVINRVINRVNQYLKTNASGTIQTNITTKYGYNQFKTHKITSTSSNNMNLLKQRMRNMDTRTAESGGDEEVVNITTRIIKPAVGGCNGKKKPIVIKLPDGTKLTSKVSTKNNCFFTAVKKDLGITEKTNAFVKRCNEIREEFNLLPNTCIPVETAMLIWEKYNIIDKPLSIVNSKGYIIDKQKTKYKFVGNNNGIEEKRGLFLMENHYYNYEGKMKSCPKCKTVYFKYHSNETCLQRTTFLKAKYYKQRSVITKAFKQQPLKDKKIVHYDIETYRNVRQEHIPYIVGFCYYVGNKLEYNFFAGDNCMEEFYIWLKTHKEYEYLNAFNGSGFDHYKILQRIFLDNDRSSVELCINNGRIIGGQAIHEKKEEKTIKKTITKYGKNGYECDIKKKVNKYNNIKFVDLYNHIQGKLSDQLEKNGCTTAKGELDHNKSIRWEDTDKKRKLQVLDYLKSDVIGLCELYEKVNKEINSKHGLNICDFTTLSQMAYHIWTRNKLKHEIMLPTLTQDTMYRQAVYGGRCYKNKHRFLSKQYRETIKELEENKDNEEERKKVYEKLYDYVFDADVVSLYPQAMTFEYPIGQAIQTTTYKKGKMGIYHIKYTPHKHILYPALPRRVEGKLMWDLIEHTGYYTSVDIEEAKKFGYKIEFIQDKNGFVGDYWEKTAKVFKDYIDDFFQEKEKLKKEGKKKTSAYLTAKLFLNALYGKQIQRPITTKSSWCKTHEDFLNILKDNEITEINQVGSKWWEVKHVSLDPEKLNKCANKPSHLGAFILSYSREIMNTYYRKLNPKEKLENLPYYFDTDSMNIHSSQLSLIDDDSTFSTKNKGLGGMDDDVGGKVIKAYWISPKMYCFEYISSEDYNLKYHYRGKGVPNNICKSKGMKMYEKMDIGSSVMIDYKDINDELGFEKYFQMKKIQVKRNNKQLHYEQFSHIHTTDIKKELNKVVWCGRKFVNDNDSVPFGYNI